MSTPTKSSPPTAREIYIHDLTAKQRDLVAQYTFACARETPPPSAAVRRALFHAKHDLENARQKHGRRFDRVMAGEESL